MRVMGSTCIPDITSQYNATLNHTSSAINTFDYYFVRFMALQVHL